MFLEPCVFGVKKEEHLLLMTKISNSIKVKFGKKLYEKLKKKYLLFTKSLTLYNSADVFHQDCDGMV